MQLVSLGEEVDAGHLRHPLVDDQQRDGGPGLRERVQLREPCLRAEGGDDPRVGREPAAEVLLEGVQAPTRSEDTRRMTGSPSGSLGMPAPPALVRWSMLCVGLLPRAPWRRVVIVLICSAAPLRDRTV